MARYFVEDDDRPAIQNCFKYLKQVDMADVTFSLCLDEVLKQMVADFYYKDRPICKAAVEMRTETLSWQLIEPSLAIDMVQNFEELSRTTPAPPPKLRVVRSNKFMKDGRVKLYSTRGRKRGVLVVFSYYKFQSRLEPERTGADVDCELLKQVFSEIGFTVISYPNRTSEETEACLAELSLDGFECVFFVFSSHGQGRKRSSDTQLRCSDGAFISVWDIVDRFNNQNCPALKGVPKIFIFQACRGNIKYPGLEQAMNDASPQAGSAMPGLRRPSADAPSDRLYSDILIAYSTVPGYISPRIRANEKGSTWYMRTLCSVFAAHAHECHVLELFALVDEKRGVQTCPVENVGFNRYLYLHPGLFEDDPRLNRPTILFTFTVILPIVLVMLVQSRRDAFGLRLVNQKLAPLLANLLKPNSLRLK